MNLLNRLLNGDMETWIGTCLITALLSATLMGSIAMFQSHEPNCYYPFTANLNQAKPYQIKGNVNWAEDHKAFKFNTSEEMSAKLQTLKQCAK